MKRSALSWLIAGLVFWGWIFVTNIRQAIAALVFAILVSAVVAIGMLSFHILRAKLGR